ncbi:MAG: hypothetical protein AB7G75_27995 [Candidatus Binatia bacterium]
MAGSCNSTRRKEHEPPKPGNEVVRYWPLSFGKTSRANYDVALGDLQVMSTDFSQQGRIDESVRGELIPITQQTAKEQLRQR